MIDAAHYPGVFHALERFRAFYAELAVAVAAVRDGSWLADCMPGDAGGDAVQAGARRLAQRLQEAVVRYAGLPGPRLPDGGNPVEMGYVLAALADEVFLQELDWPGRACWDELLLEERLYGTRIAGERLFDLAEQLIAARAAGQDDLVVALMQAFALGFRGRYRGGNDRGAICRLRRQLYQLALHRPAPMTVEWLDALPPSEALTGGSLARVPRLRPWIYGAIGAVLLFFLLTPSRLVCRDRGTLAAADRIVAADRSAVR
ncbi:MAG: DotU family type IV/VI secretion system protein [Aliidongia sp.]